MKVRILRKAAADLEAAHRYYEENGAGLGLQFVDAFQAGLARITAMPFAWHPMNKRFRRYLLNRFPYGIVYRVADNGNLIIVQALMHTSRRPRL